MTGKAPEQEPSIEEILASIRQIISDDDETREPVEVEVKKEEKFEIPVHQPEPVKEEPRASFADVLELTNEIAPEEKVIKHVEEPKFEIPSYKPEPEKSSFDIDFQEPPPRPAEDYRAPMSNADTDALFSQPAASATTDAFSRLIGNMPIEREERTPSTSHGGVTLEDITRDLLRPMLRQWIDDNVPRLVERLVEKELEKLARKARD